MYVRLAFAVAAHLRSEILIVDEVLAVGDAEFQKKCLGKMKEVSTDGRTVLFVSHNMEAIKLLCTVVILLSNGMVSQNGTAAIAAAAYQGVSFEGCNQYTASDTNAVFPQVNAIQVHQANSDESSIFRMDVDIQLDITLNQNARRPPEVVLRILDENGVCIHHTSDEFGRWRGDPPTSQRRCTIPAFALAPGRYRVSIVLVADNRVGEVLDNCVSFGVRYSGPLSERVPESAWEGISGGGLLKWTFQESSEQPNTNIKSPDAFSPHSSASALSEYYAE